MYQSEHFHLIPFICRDKYNICMKFAIFCLTFLFINSCSSIIVPDVTEKTATTHNFFDYAFSLIGIDESEKDGKWLGGLARTWNHPVFAKENGRWVYSDANTFAESLIKIDEGKSSAYICWYHDCLAPAKCVASKCTGYVAQTSAEENICEAYIWQTHTALYFLIKIAEEKCGKVLSHVKTGSHQASILRRCVTKESIYDNVKHRHLQLCRKGSIPEISLTEYPRDETTWVSVI